LSDLSQSGNDGASKNRFVDYQAIELFHAVQQANIDRVFRSLDYGADIEYHDDDGRTALVIAAKNNIYRDGVFIA
jgi:ankyrin repeat protein